MLAKRCVGLAIKLYRKSPLYPRWISFLARLRHFMQRGKRCQRFVYDVGSFKLHINLNPVIGAQVSYTGTFEPKTVSTIRKVLAPGHAAIDIGANTGYMTRTMASCVGTSGTITAFEPTAWAFDRLRENIHLNDMVHVNIENLGVSDHDHGGLATAIKSSYELGGESDEPSDNISLATLDSYIKDNPIKRLDFIKIDTDGMEAQVIGGATQTLQKFSPMILFEVAPDHLQDHKSSSDYLIALLRQLDYRFYHEDRLEPFDNLQEMIQRLPNRTYINVVAQRVGREEPSKD
jgi:FkbM family methyltransferase